MSDIAVWSAAFAGLASFFSPCVFPLLPLYLAVIVPEKNKKGKLEVLFQAISFIGGFSLVFILLGLTASAIGAALMEWQHVFREIGAIFMICMGVFQIGLVTPRMLLREWRPALPLATSRGGSFFLGMAFVFGWIPCTSPLLSSILMYAGMKDSVYYGAYLLTAYSVGFSLPLLLAALLTDSFTKKMKDRALSFLVPVQKIAGVIMICVGLLLYFNKLTEIIAFFY